LNTYEVQASREEDLDRQAVISTDSIIYTEIFDSRLS